MEHEVVDLVLLDVVRRREDGMMLAQRLRAESATGEAT
jgi:DNA-binding response OmpR family regulator